MSLHPAEFARMTPIQRELLTKLRAKHWHFSMLYHRSIYFRPTEKITWPDGSVHRTDSWRRPGIKVTPTGRILKA